jgi:hypothetical protein
MRPAARLLLFPLLLLLLSVLSCFEPPVREALRLRFLPGGAVLATSTVEIDDEEVEDANPALARRLDDARRMLLDGSDAWGVRFAAANAAAERFAWEKQLGVLRTARRSALFAEPRDLEALFRDTSLAVTYAADPQRGVAELAIVPGPSTRASRQQREETERTLAAWSGAVADYLRTVQELYAYLDERPGRARPCFASLFGKRLSEQDAKSVGKLTAEEEGKLDRLDDAMGKILEILAVPKGAAYSPDEVSHLVYDPFPARLSVKLPGAPMELEGFQKDPDGVLTVPSPGLWQALRSLQGRWLSPDPAVLYVEGGREGKGADFDLEGFLTQPRQAVPAHLLPTAPEVRTEIEARLKPASLYHAAWKFAPRDEKAEIPWEEGR